MFKRFKTYRLLMLALVVLFVQLPVWAQEAGGSAGPASAPVAAPSGSGDSPSGDSGSKPSGTSPNGGDNNGGARVDPDSSAPPKSSRGSQGTWKDVKTLDGLEEALQSEVQVKLRSLPRFGEDFFKRSKEELVKSQAGAVPEDYAISTGDELTVTTYNTRGGATVQNVPVSNAGDTYLKGIGPMNVAGMSRGQAEAEIDARYRERFPNMRSRVSFAKIPQINVTVLGEARVPGSYQMNPGSTVLDALLFAKGPSDSGSYRAVQLQRDGKVIAWFDIYNVLVYGKTAATRLRNGDRIFIPLMGDEIAVTGEVKRPGRYELRNETTLKHILNLAGGVVADGFSTVLKVNRVSSNQMRRIVDIGLKEAASFKVQNGDIVTVAPVTDNLKNGVYLSGAVTRPGWYQLVTGMRVSELIRQAEGLARGAYAGHAELFREDSPTEPLRMRGIELDRALQGDPAHDLRLQPQDRLVVYDASDALFNKERVRIQGEVKDPGEYPRYREMKIRDLLVLAGGTTPEAATKAEVTRPGPDGRLAFIPVNLEGVMSSADSPENIELQPLDVVIIRKELRKRRWPASITLAGEFRNPGVYTVDPERETLQSVVERAGGLTPQAYPKAAVFTRPIPEIMRPDRKDLAADVFSNIQEVVRQIAKVENARRQRVASQPSDSLTQLASGGEVAAMPRVLDKVLSTDRIPVDLVSMMNQGIGDPGIKDGDVLYVPQEPEMVIVSGAVLMPSPIVWQPGKSAKAYIKRTGGFAKDAAEDEVVVMRVNGELVKARDAGDIEPGDLIMVPPKALIAYPGAFEKFLSVLQVVSGAFVASRIFQ